MMLSFAEIQGFLNELPSEAQPELHITVLRNITIEPIEPYLRYLAYQIGFDAHVHWGSYDNIIQDAISENSQLLNNRTDCVLIFLKLEVISPSLTYYFSSLSIQQIEAELDRILEYVRAILQGIRSQTKAMILWMGFERPVNPALGIVDLQMTSGQTATIQKLNTSIQKVLLSQENSYFVDLDLSLARLGSANYFDHRYWHIGRSPFTRMALYDIAAETFKYIRALKGANKKCIVLDCDNTLWGGVVGEDGLSGIKLSSNSYPGSGYYEFQQEIVNLYHRGILVALCSKNNESEVWDVFRNHPDMVLKESHVACAKINWNDKASNLHQIAQELNIGVDSMVFVDDSEFEVNLVQQLIPEVETISLPSKRSTEYRLILSSCGWFDTLALTQEDSDRGAMYSAERKRIQVKREFTSIEQYHQSLEMVVEFTFPDACAMPRIAQLTQKTNQFNFTTKRYTEADIASFAESECSDVFYMRLRDKFGNYGIVGVCVLSYENSEATIDSLLMSCRVLGRYVEDAFLHQALDLAHYRRCKIIWGLYCRTRKNSQVETYYIDRGFIKESPERFYLDLGQIEGLPKNRFLGKVVSQLCVRG
jgi:FkbH-like protein